MKYNLSEIMKNAWAIRRNENTNMSSALKKAWAQAKKKEAEELEHSEIKALVEKYNLVLCGDKVRTYQTKGIDPEKFRAEVGPRKEEIIQYLKAMEQEKHKSLKAMEQEKHKSLERHLRTLDAIPGVQELRRAREQRAAWQRAFDEMMETGSSKMEYVEAPSAEEIKTMERIYPMAVFALEAEYRSSDTQNYQLFTIWQETYTALCNGQNPQTVKSAHDQKMSAYASQHMWD